MSGIRRLPISSIARSARASCWGRSDISLAGVGLIYVGLKVLVASVETMHTMRAIHRADAPQLDERGA